MAKWCQVGDYSGQVGTSRGQVGAKLAQVGTKLGQVGTQVGAKSGQVGDKLAPSWGQVGPMLGPKLGQLETKMQTWEKLSFTYSTSHHLEPSSTENSEKRVIRKFRWCTFEIRKNVQIQKNGSSEN